MSRPVFAPFGEDNVVELSTKGNFIFTRGSFGEISIALRRSQGKFELVAIKTIEYAISAGQTSFGSRSSGPPKLSRDIANEICALRHLNPHPNVATLLACFPSKSPLTAGVSISLVFEYSPIDLCMALEWRRRKSLPPLSLPTIASITCDLFGSLAHCHRFGVLHRDIKPGNILITASGRVQLCDFGLAKPYLVGGDIPLPPPTSVETGTRGLCTLWYRPPEVLLGGPATHPAVDIYSAGLVLTELLSGKPLLAGPSNVVGQLARTYEVLGSPSDATWPGAKFLPDHGKLMFSSHEPKRWPDLLPRMVECPGLERLIAGTVALDPSQRLSAIKVLKHSFLAGTCSKSARDAPARELIPPSLSIPPLLAESNVLVMTTVAMSSAKRRISFAKEGMMWHGSDLPSVTLKALAAEC